MNSLQLPTVERVREVLTPTDIATKEWFGVHYLQGWSFVFRRVHECEHHICHQCANAAHDELRKVMQASAEA